MRESVGQYGRVCEREREVTNNKKGVKRESDSNLRGVSSRSKGVSVDIPKVERVLVETRDNENNNN